MPGPPGYLPPHTPHSKKGEMDEGDKYAGGPGTETRTPAHGSSQIVYLMMRVHIDHVEGVAPDSGRIYQSRTVPRDRSSHLDRSGPGG